MPRELKSVEEYNAEQRAIREEFLRTRHLTGVACPNDGAELEWSFEPPQTLRIKQTRTARCPSCSLWFELERT